ncbi:S8 family serine peptidase [Streptomyces zingiberis]|nr:S8 family serine peptidase [Streptomyces zingiberis]
MTRVQETLRRSFCAVAVLSTLGATALGAAPTAAAQDVRSKQWYLDAMHAEEIWKKATGEGIKVAVIDSGVNAATPSLKGQVLKGKDLTDRSGDETSDYDGHGTNMAELIAGTGKGGGIQGLAPGAKIIPFRIQVGLPKGAINRGSIPNAIKAAGDSDAQIISMSIGSEYFGAQEEEAIKYARSQGKLLLAAAGNNAKEGNGKSYPAAYPEVVGVAATGPDGKVADYSQHGEVIDLAAPANEIPLWCDATFKSYCDSNGGTSSATAIASASAALIWSANPDWTANQVLRVMIESAGRGEDWPEGPSNYLGHGIVRPGAHINRGIGKPGAPDIDPLTNEKTGGGNASDTSGSSDKGGSDSSTSESSEPASSQPGQDGSDDDTAVAGSDKTGNDGGSTGLLIAGAAAVAALGGAGFFILRRRRTA